jgi:N-succinyldiaminopimelate aminotransferase
MVRDHGLAAIPLSSFYVGPEPENHYLRFAFCKKKEELEEATRRLARI